MSIIAIRQSNRHRPAPIREGVAWRCKNAISRDPPQRKVMGTHFDMGHLSDFIARQIGLSVMSIGEVITQIPIDRSLL